MFPREKVKERRELTSKFPEVISRKKVTCQHFAFNLDTTHYVYAQEVEETDSTFVVTDLVTGENIVIYKQAMALHKPNAEIEVFLLASPCGKYELSFFDFPSHLEIEPIPFAQHRKANTIYHNCFFSREYDSKPEF
ncbi:TPA: hypothetical protein ACPVZG_000607 [Vibrio parahaemolyticus]